MNNIIVFATYWNEIDWVKPSLKQIEKLNPKEVIICDGCFDPRTPNYSTDGTREIIEKWVAKRENARMISAVRVSKLKAFWMMLKGHKKSKFCQIFTPTRLKSLYLTLVDNIYRVNQALTFQYMIFLSREWKPGTWFMCYDCDQFYSDAMMEEIKELVNKKTDIELLIGNELTFFKDFKHCTTQYEKRKYNNMPHKIHPDTSIWPTRGIILENWSSKSFDIKRIFLNEFYINKVKSKNIGDYFHYKFKFSKERSKKGYELGDRKKPDIKQYKMKKYVGDHPDVIKRFFKKLLK